jgi:Lrp/AsnC family leucine-responsive transcriptional regulator
MTRIELQWRLRFDAWLSPENRMSDDRSETRSRLPVDRPLSDLDRRLIALLQQDCRRTYSEMAAILKVSRPTVKERIDRLIERGVITRFTVELAEKDESEPDGPTAFFHLQLRRPLCRAVYASISGWPELLGCWSVAGSTDMTILVRCATHGELEFLRDRLARHPEVKTLWTALCLKQWHHAIIKSRPVPIERDGDSSSDRAC